MFDFQQGGMILKKYLPILKNSPFFTGLTDNEILSILHCVKATAVSQKRDSYIFRAGDSTEVMGLVVSGCVLVIQEDLWGHRNILSNLTFLLTDSSWLIIFVLTARQCLRRYRSYKKKK